MKRLNFNYREESLLSKEKYWYKIHIGECPICGRDQSYRERIYG